MSAMCNRVAASDNGWRALVAMVRAKLQFTGLASAEIANPSRAQGELTHDAVPFISVVDGVPNLETVLAAGEG